MTLRKLIWQLIEELNDYGITDDNVLDYEYIKDMLLVANKTLFDQYVNSKGSLDGFYQEVNCIELECMQHECTISGILFKDENYFMVADLPPLIKTIGYSNIRYFGLHGYVGDIDRVSLDLFMNSHASKWTSKQGIYTVIGDKLIAKNIPKMMKTALLICILSDPTQACDWTDDNEFPTPSEFKLKLIVKKDITSLHPVAPDLQHDAQRALGKGIQGRERGRRDDSSDNSDNQNQQ
jgi:hypothetical protein